MGAAGAAVVGILLVAALSVGHRSSRERWRRHRVRPGPGTETLNPGLHFRAPFVNVVHPITTRVQPHEFKEIDAASSEYQSVKLTGVMNYHIDGSAAADLYQRVGDEFAEKILDPAFNDFIKSVVPEYSITTILGKRDEIRSRAKHDLQANLSQYHIVVDDIYIANIAFSAEYEKAIEAKQVAQQQVRDRESRSPSSASSRPTRQSRRRRATRTRSARRPRARLTRTSFSRRACHRS
jgi:regulator of protease activity HflC (stomatin/prohibitin superfamily)